MLGRINSQNETKSRHKEGRADKRGPLPEWVMYGLLVVLALITVFVGATIAGRSYIVVSGLLLTYVLAGFFISFECRHPGTRELALLSVMCALAVASRAAFVWVPYFKPTAAIVMITGMALGPTSGFLVGAMSMLLSNFIFGQGPWTPWQMFSFGLCGLVFGFLSRKIDSSNTPLSRKSLFALSAAGFLFIVLIAGPILDTSSLFFMVSRISPESVAAIYLAGLPVNCIHGAATFTVLILLGNPVLKILFRMRSKYGIGNI